NGVLPPEQRGGSSGVIDGTGGASPHCGLGCPSRKRNAVNLLGRSQSPLRFDSSVPVLPGNRESHRGRRSKSTGSYGQYSTAGGGNGRCRAISHRPRGASNHRGVLPRLGTGLVWV